VVTPLAQPLRECTHQGLLQQLEAKLASKEEEVQQLREVLGEWSRLIGFDRPLSQRLQRLVEASKGAEQLNAQWGERLRGRGS
jgi:hypothetical protein